MVVGSKTKSIHRLYIYIYPIFVTQALSKLSVVMLVYQRVITKDSIITTYNWAIIWMRANSPILWVLLQLFTGLP